MLPVLGGKIIELQQHVAILRQTCDGLLILHRIGFLEQIKGFDGFGFGLRHPDLLKLALGFGMKGLWNEGALE